MSDDAALLDAALRLGVLGEDYVLEVRVLSAGGGGYIPTSQRRVHLFDYRKTLARSAPVGGAFSECGKAVDLESEPLQTHKVHDGRRRFLNNLPVGRYIEPPLCKLCARTIRALLGKESA